VHTTTLSLRVLASTASVRTTAPAGHFGCDVGDVVGFLLVIVS
jgi:hypothetical protein